MPYFCPMQIIASNAKGSRQNKRLPFWPLVLAFSVLAFILLVFFQTQLPFFNYLILPLVCVVVVSLVFTVSGRIRNLKSPFCAYTDGQNLMIDFVSQSGNNYGRFGGMNGFRGADSLRRISCSFHQIAGYKLHTFFKKPSVLELQKKEGPDMILNIVIPIDSLNRKEIQKLVDFLEQIIPHHTVERAGRLGE